MKKSTGKSINLFPILYVALMQAFASGSYFRFF
jgi:hypothetical protein